MAKINISIELNAGESLDDAVAQLKSQVPSTSATLGTHNGIVTSGNTPKAKEETPTPPPAEGGKKVETPTLDELRKILTPIMKDNKAAIKDKLKSFDAKNLSELSESSENMVTFYNWVKTL